MLKKILKSKTIWFNVITGIVLVVDALSGKFIPTEIAVSVVAVCNIILRLVTNKSISDK